MIAYRGPEYRPFHGDFEVRAGGENDLELLLERWTDQPSLGWYSGESHIHANYGRGYWYQSPRAMCLLCAGEDLHVANLMVTNSDGDGVFDREYFRGRPDKVSTEETLLYWNEEFPEPRAIGRADLHGFHAHDTPSRLHDQCGHRASHA